jgi:hypothetical protein
MHALPAASRPSSRALLSDGSASVDQRWRAAAPPPQAFDYLTGFMGKVEQAIYAADSAAWRVLLEPISLVDYLLGTEVTKNPDGYRGSVYASKVCMWWAGHCAAASGPWACCCFRGPLPDREREGSCDAPCVF